MTRKLVTVGLAGAGGVGKSTLMRLFEAEGYALMPSISRQYYAERGLKSEQEYLNLSAESKKDFQRGMLNFYMESFDAFRMRHMEENIIADRTVFDHFAYNIYSNPGMYTLQEFEDLRATIKEYAENVYTHIFYIPYPQPWMHHTSIEDGFRATDPCKNFAVASIMNHALHTANLENTFIYDFEASNDTPDQTFERMLDMIYGV